MKKQIAGPASVSEEEEEYLDVEVLEESLKAGQQHEKLNVKLLSDFQMEVTFGHVKQPVLWIT